MRITVTNLTGNVLSTDIGYVGPKESRYLDLDPVKAHKTSEQLKPLVDAGYCTIHVSEEADILDEIEFQGAALLQSDLASTAVSKGAALVGINNAGALYTATDVEGALAEVKTIADAANGTVKRAITVAFGDFAGLGAGVKSHATNIGAVLPANARFLGLEIILDAAFTDGAAIATCTLDVGGSDPNSLVAAESLLAANSGKFPMGLGCPSGSTGFVSTPGTKAYPFASYSAQQLVATIASDVDLNTLNAGSVTINVFYVVLA